MVTMARCRVCFARERDPLHAAIHVICDNYACDKYDTMVTCIPAIEIWGRIDLGS